jgi:hypothetical protein
MDTVGGFLLADGRRAKALAGIDDHSRFCVSAHPMLRETAQRVCDGLALTMRTFGVPESFASAKAIGPGIRSEPLGVTTRKYGSPMRAIGPRQVSADRTAALGRVLAGQDEPRNGDRRRWASPVALCFRRRGDPSGETR